MIYLYINRYFRKALHSALIFAFLAPAYASDIESLLDQSFLSAEEAFRVNAFPEPNGITIIWTIAPEYYLYKHQFKIFDDDADLTHSAVFSEGIDTEDEYFGEVTVYFHQAIAWLPRNSETSCTPDDKDCKPLELTIKYQGCAEAGLCYPVQTSSVIVAKEASR